MVKNRLFEPKLTKKYEKIGLNTTKKGLKPLFSWYQTYAFNMGRLNRIELSNVWFTARCVNHFTTAAKCNINYIDNENRCKVKNYQFEIFLLIKEKKSI